MAEEKELKPPPFTRARHEYIRRTCKFNELCPLEVKYEAHLLRGFLTRRHSEWRLSERLYDNLSDISLSFEQKLIIHQDYVISPDAEYQAKLRTCEHCAIDIQENILGHVYETECPLFFDKMCKFLHVYTYYYCKKYPAYSRYEPKT